MNIDKELEFIKSTVYHELGHVLGYCLAGKSEKTDLGEIKYIELGFPNNFVTPKISYYHEEKNILEEIDRFKKTTSNTQRTTAWFIEVILGCTTQVIFENLNFKSCFGHSRDFNGRIDFSNLSLVRNVSSFTWNFDDIYELQKELQIILTDDDLVIKLEEIVCNLLEKIRVVPKLQLKLSSEEVKTLSNEINLKISTNLYKQYLSLINKYSEFFESSPDLVAVLNFIEQPQENIIYRSNEVFIMDFPNLKSKISGKIKFVQKNNIKHGETVHGEIEIKEMKGLNQKLKIKQEFNITQGSKIICSGTIMNIKNEYLLAST
jgi:hypothetical protein